MAYTLPDLPYGRKDLEPHISERTLYFHHQKHHKGYVDKLNAMIEGDERNGQPLEWLVAHTEGKLFTMAAQAWNHAFYWPCMRADGGGEPHGELAELIEAKFGRLQEFKDEFTEVASNEFGSGWAWVVYAPEKHALEVFSTTDAENPVPQHARPLLTLDVWEHAYYLDWQNDRGKYIEAFLSHLVNWEFAAENLQRAKQTSRKTA